MHEYSSMNKRITDSCENKTCMLILGPPGSGKGTQAGRLALRFDLAHLSLGEILRSEVRTGGEYANSVSSYLSAGEPLPVELMSKILTDRIRPIIRKQGFIGDGLVRNLEQVRELDKILECMNLQLKLVFLLELSSSEILRRLQGRLTCSQCGAIYNVDYDSPAVLGVCDKDGFQLAHRSDDRDELVRKRIYLHNKSLSGITSYYQNKGILRRIDGAKTINAVFENISVIINNR